MTWASAGLTSHLSISYLLTKLFERLVHKLGSPKCVVAGISVCSNIYFIKRIAKRKKRISLIPPPVTNAEIRPSGNLAEKNWQKMKIPNSGLSVFTSGSTGRIYQLQDRSLCRMRYLHYPTLENTRSFIKIIAKRKKRISLIPSPVTTAEIRPSRNLTEKKWQKMKIPNSGLNVFLSGSTGRVYQLQDRSLCRMRYLHYPSIENTRSVMKLRTHMSILLNDQSLWRITGWVLSS